MTESRHKLRVRVRGAGIIGLTTAWRLHTLGVDVTLIDDAEPGRGASWAAAGMLAPGFEAAGEVGLHPGLFELCLESAALWPAFAAQIEAAAGHSVGYCDLPTLAVARTDEDAAHLRAIEAALRARGIPAERLDSGALRRAAPELSAGIDTGLLLPGDHHVENRRLVTALVDTLQGAGVLAGEMPTGGDFDVEVIATGWRTPGVVPVKGQMLSLRPSAAHPARVIRCGGLYIVPKLDRTIIGATVERGVSAGDVEAAQIDALQARAAEVCPALAQGERLESWAGIRPEGRGHAPLIGFAGPGQIVAAGHFRNGILLAPVTAEIVADLVLGRALTPLRAAFAPPRGR